MIRPARTSHGIKPFQMYSVGAVRRETQNIFDHHGQTYVNYKSHAGQAMGEFAYLAGNTPVYTCLAKDFRAWAETSEMHSQAA